MVDFMYYGEVNINLESFLNLAKELKIQGLESQEMAEDLVSTKQVLSPMKKMKGINHFKNVVKKEMPEYLITTQLDDEINIEANQSQSIKIPQDDVKAKMIREEIRSMVEKNERGYMCKVCGISMSKKTSYWESY